MLIGITGSLGSGKSTLSSHFKNLGYTEYSFATPLKQICEILGFTPSQLYGTLENKLEINEFWGVSGRTFLQLAGTELFRNKLNEILPESNIKSVWVELFRKKYLENPKNYVVQDVRFDEEARIIKELGGVVIRLSRKSNISSDSGVEHKHSSEKGISEEFVDLVIDNSVLSVEETKNTVMERLKM